MNGFGGFDGLESVLGGGQEIESAEYVPPAVELEPLAVPAESAGWSLGQWELFASVGVAQAYLRATEAAFLGVPVEVSWERAAVFYDRVVAEQRREAAEQFARETRLYWSGRPDLVTRQILRAYGLTVRQLGLVQRSAFSDGYRRRQRARVKRRRR